VNPVRPHNPFIKNRAVERAVRPVVAVALVAALFLAGCMGSGRPQTRPPAGDLAASFVYNPEVPLVGESVAFEDTTPGQVVLRAWDFGDGGTSEDARPLHVYRASGEFTVRLLVEDVEGNVGQTQRTLTVGELGTGPSGFRVDFRYNVNGRTVDFEPLLTPEGSVVDLYHWDFGDGSISRDSAPSHTYTGEAIYEVTFRASSQARIAQAKHLIAIGVDIGEPTELADKSFAVIAIIDSGINPYHSEFRDERFQAHPAQYVSGFPATAQRLDLALDAATFKEATVRDEATWSNVATRTLYWIPGTRIIGAISMDPYGSIPILDEDGHGTATASDAVGATVGPCPECLVVIIEGPGEAALDWAFRQPWIDAVSNSWTFCVPLSIAGCAVDPGVIPEVLYDPEPTRRAVEAGQEILFSAGNGVLNAFDVPQPTYLHSQTGPDWILTVGSADATNSARTFGTGRPFDVTSYGVNWRGASHQSMNSIRSFSGTSAATPIVAGAYGEVLRSVRVALGDTQEGPRPGAVVAQGAAVAGFVSDGKLTRAEAERVLLLTARSDGSSATVAPVGLPGGPGSFVYSGYGLVNAASAADAVRVALGDLPVPSRPNEDLWASVDSTIRRSLYGNWNPGGEFRDAMVDDARINDLLGALGLTRQSVGLR
jgi:hypothetical protein